MARPKITAWDVVLANIFLCILVYLFVYPDRIGHDCAHHLQFSIDLLAGKRPYVDFYDPNLPLIWYLGTIPVLVARLFALPVAFVFSLGVLLLLVVSTWVARRLALPCCDKDDRWGMDLVIVVWALCSVEVLMGVFLGPHLVIDYGQREHLFLLCYFPYLIACWARQQQKEIRHTWAILVGVGAGIGVCLKPMFVLIPLVHEAVILYRARSVRAIVRPESIGLLAIGMVYLAHFALLPSEVRDSLFGRWLPFVLTRYGSYTSVDGLFSQAVLVAVAVAAIPYAIPRSARHPFYALARLFAAGTFAAVVIYLVQRKGWTYHLLPFAFMCVAALTVLIAAGLVEQRKGSREERLLIAVLLVVINVGTAIKLWFPSPSIVEIETEKFSQILEAYSKPNDQVLVLWRDVVPTYPPLLTKGRRPASRYHILFPLPMIYSDVASDLAGPFPYRKGRAQTVQERLFLAELMSDIAANKPPLIVGIRYGVCTGCPKGFQTWEYLEQQGVLDVIRKDYRQINEDRFAIFVPRP